MSLDLTLKNREFNFNVTKYSQHKVYEFEDFRLDTATRLLYRNGDQVLITPKAVETLIALVEGQADRLALAQREIDGLHADIARMRPRLVEGRP